MNNKKYNVINVTNLKENDNTIQPKRSTNSVKYGEFTALNYVSGVYYIKNKYTNRMYIGSSTSIGKRISKHFSECRFNRHHTKDLQADFTLYGQSAFEYGVLLETTSLLEEEMKFQKKFSTENLYNTVVNNFITDSTRAKIGSANSTSWKNKSNDELLTIGKNISTAKTKYSIVMIDKKGNIVKFYNTVFDVLIDYPTLKTQPIRAVCNNGKQSYANYIWKYVEKGKEDSFKVLKEWYNMYIPIMVIGIVSGEKDEILNYYDIKNENKKARIKQCCEFNKKQLHEGLNVYKGAYKKYWFYQEDIIPINSI